ncbi:pyridoxamine 5'-phosphate oxidase family protein [Actinoplanes sp. NPDC049596]|uniref:pyridoxamine 5'-phosphate oxidase family protein n=1 Tax=unclassified Actinoplanes TaxID=2626549 RepID=UPI00341F6C34
MSTSIRAMRRTGPSLTAKDVWRAISRASFAVLAHVTPAGAPRSSGVVYILEDGRLYVAVAADSWKARHVAADGMVAMTVPIRRGGPLSLMLPIPPGTVSFPAVAVVHPGDHLAHHPRLARLLPPDRRGTCVILEIRPTGHFVTYGLGVPLSAMRDPARSRARIPAGR